jgi:hypothetical protein
MALGIQYAGSDRLGHDPSFVSEYSTSVGYVLYYGYGLIWRPYLRDSIVPFIIGIQEFMLVTLIGEEFNTLLLYVLGTIFISGNWVSHSSLRRARQDPENAEFFGQVEPATLRDFWPAMTIVSCLAVFGISIDVTQNQTWLPLLALIFSNAVLIFQTFAFRRLWRGIMDFEDAGQNLEAEE